jgi:hypothetical protein
MIDRYVVGFGGNSNDVRQETERYYAAREQRPRARDLQAGMIRLRRCTRLTGGIG